MLETSSFATNWKAVAKEAGALWFHSRDPRDPLEQYALLTRGDIANGYCNFDRLIRKAGRIEQMAGHLLKDPRYIAALESTPGAVIGVPQPQPPTTMSSPPTRIEDERRIRVRVVCAAHGAVTLGHAVAFHLGCEVAIAVKNADDKIGPHSLDRFAIDFIPDEPILLVEDTVTRGGTVLALRDEVRRIVPKAPIVPCVLTFCHWQLEHNERDFGELEFASLISPQMTTWKLGRNPYTHGNELVEPLRPKDNWHRFVPRK